MSAMLPITEHGLHDIEDRVNIERYRDSKVISVRHFERVLVQDEMILGALKCAKLHGYTGEA